MKHVLSAVESEIIRLTQLRKDAHADICDLQQRLDKRKSWDAELDVQLKELEAFHSEWKAKSHQPDDPSDANS